MHTAKLKQATAKYAYRMVRQKVMILAWLYVLFARGKKQVPGDAFGGVLGAWRVNRGLGPVG